MAAKSSKKRSTKTGQKRKASKKQVEQGFVADEILIWVTLAVSILLLLSNFDLGGPAGAMASRIQREILGLAAYAFPFILFGLTAFLTSNKENWKAWVRAFAVVVLVVFACTFLELLLGAGGWLGSTVSENLSPAIGVIGTYVVVFAGSIICMVIITGKSAWKGVQHQGGKAYQKAKMDAARRRELHEERQRELDEERQREQKERSKSPRGKGNVAKRRDHLVEGVSFDTTLEKKKAPQMQEPDIEEPEKAWDSDFVINRGAQPDTADAAKADQETMVESAFMGEPAQTEMPVQADGAFEKKSKPKTEHQEMNVAGGEPKPEKAYRFPSLSLLKRGKKNGGESDATLRETAHKLQQTLQNFGVNVTVANVSCGPAVTRYELQPDMGVKVSKIVGLADDIKLNLAAADIRIEAPIPGKAAVGIEVPNKENSAVMLRDLLETKEFKESKSKLSFAAGKDIGGKPVVTDIAKMPHLLIAGATGSGKSVCINTLIMSILYKATPDEVKLIMVDPKVVELSVYNGIPHLMIPVVTDPKKAAGALNWAVAEMTRRYQAFAEHNVRDMKGYNEKIMAEPEINGSRPAKMAQIVIIVDELADLMMVASGEVEEAICRLAQLARAAGIHLVVATQRPSVNVITGLIKANMPSRIAFAVSSGVDSRTIIDMNGAEKLLGKGDMLFYPAGYPKPARVQGSFVSDQEVQAVVEFLKKTNEAESYDEEVVHQVNTAEVSLPEKGGVSEEDGRDSYFADAGRLIIEKEKASIGMLQRAFKIGFNRAARIMDQLCEAGVVGGEEGTKPRKVLMTMEEFEQALGSNSDS